MSLNAGLLLLTLFVPAPLPGAYTEPRTPKGHQGSVMAVAFSPDGKVPATAATRLSSSGTRRPAN